MTQGKPAVFYSFGFRDIDDVRHVSNESSFPFESPWPTVGKLELLIPDALEAIEKDISKNPMALVQILTPVYPKATNRRMPKNGSHEFHLET